MIPFLERWWPWLLLTWFVASVLMAWAFGVIVSHTMGLDPDVPPRRVSVG